MTEDEGEREQERESEQDRKLERKQKRESERERENAASRRTILKTAGAAGAIAGIAQIAGRGRAQATEIALDGETSGWVGRSPSAISGETNPTLDLEPGQTYRVTWTNADGAPHSFVIEDADGNRLAGTEVVAEQGASRTLEFEATPAMAEYYCEVHPQSMRGQVAVGEAAATAEDGTTTDDGTTGGQETTEDAETTADSETTTEQGPPPVIDEGPIVLGGRAAYWLGLAPSGLQGRTNPTLRLQEGQEYELVWMNLDGVEHDFHIIDAQGEDVADTSAREDVGDSHETSFEASSEMAEYYCDFHPQSMVGAVEIV